MKKSTYARYKAAGRCTTCGAPPQAGKLKCEKCLQYTRDYRRKRLETGVCVRCGAGKPEAGRSCCIPCRDRYRELTKSRSERLYKAGLCVRCGRVPATRSGACEACALKHEASGKKNATQRRLQSKCYVIRRGQELLYVFRGKRAVERALKALNGDGLDVVEVPFEPVQFCDRKGT